eukprot:CAMPEP_0194567382 /NCGR_PEP_ID=MMETSP0292-20121207/5873_1 /TAXON_ID=39354 /ORGANISM="Heterosigma akashiwo, Strain CCMP2393" /LENGTH=487 /DNA_ID=CAMNT_0039417127 /DNA_START=658 /DNA_END=2121 /DNA_ORIENTATION=-
MDILVFEDIRKIEAALLEPLCFRGSSLIIFRMRSASLPLVFPTTAEEDNSTQAQSLRDDAQSSTSDDSPQLTFVFGASLHLCSISAKLLDLELEDDVGHLDPLLLGQVLVVHGAGDVLQDDGQDQVQEEVLPHHVAEDEEAGRANKVPRQLHDRKHDPVPVFTHHDIKALLKRPQKVVEPNALSLLACAGAVHLPPEELLQAIEQAAHSAESQHPVPANSNGAMAQEETVGAVVKREDAAPSIVTAGAQVPEHTDSASTVKEEGPINTTTTKQEVDGNQPAANGSHGAVKMEVDDTSQHRPDSATNGEKAVDTNKDSHLPAPKSEEVVKDEQKQEAEKLESSTESEVPKAKPEELIKDEQEEEDEDDEDEEEEEEEDGQHLLPALQDDGHQPLGALRAPRQPGHPQHPEEAHQAQGADAGAAALHGRVHQAAQHDEEVQPVRPALQVDVQAQHVQLHHHLHAEEHGEHHVGRVQVLLHARPQEPLAV